MVAAENYVLSGIGQSNQGTDRPAESSIQKTD